MPVAGADLVVVGRGITAGRPLALLFSRRSENATVTVCHTGTKASADHARRADIVIAAAGVPGLVTADMVRPGAAVLDVGITRVVGADGKGRYTGDVDPAATEVAGYIAPMPGGVGPMTRAMLLTNVVEAAEAAAALTAGASGWWPQTSGRWRIPSMAEPPPRVVSRTSSPRRPRSPTSTARAGRLFYRGYDIHDLAGRISFEECVHLLQRGTLPTQAELDAFDAPSSPTAAASARRPGLLVPYVVRSRHADGGAAHAGVARCPSTTPTPPTCSTEADRRKALRLVAQTPVLVAAYQAARTGPPRAGGRSDARHRRRTSCCRSPASALRAESAQILDECLVLHADHTMNASTFAARVMRRDAVGHALGGRRRDRHAARARCTAAPTRR